VNDAPSLDKSEGKTKKCSKKGNDCPRVVEIGVIGN